MSILCQVLRDVPHIEGRGGVHCAWTLHCLYGGGHDDVDYVHSKSVVIVINTLVLNAVCVVIVLVVI